MSVDVVTAAAAVGVPDGFSPTLGPGTVFVPATPEWNDRRDEPDAELAELVRSSFPTEQEYETVLGRKLRRRGNGPYTLPTREEMSSYVHGFFRAHLDGDFVVSEERWLTGGASKIQYGFTLAWDDGAGTSRTAELVVRMEPSESLNATSRLREHQLIQALHGVLPLPSPYWVDPDGTWFPEPAIVYEFMTGVTKPSQDRARVSGTGTRFSPELRATLGPQFVHHLADLHAFDWSDALDLSAFDAPQVGTTQSALWQLNRARRVWEEDRGEDLPLVEVAAQWLEENLPILDHVSVLHGDFRSGNFLFDEPTGQITAWLDWERGHLGDRHRDLAWTSTRLFGNKDEDGRDFLISGLVPEQQFYEDYEARSGLVVDPVRLHYFRVFNAYQLVISNLATGYRVVRLAKSHQDVLIAFVEGAVYSLAKELLDALEEGPR